MSELRVINVDLAKVWGSGDPKSKDFIRTLAFGDFVEVEEETKTHLRIRTTRFVEKPDGTIKPISASGFIRPPKSSKVKVADVTIPRSESRVLKVNFVDVQQGDGAVVEMPDGTIMLIDGGDNQLFARYLAGRYRNTREDKPRKIDCILVTHGDADHFLGLTEIHASEKNATPHKRLFISPQRVYHNGLVKRPAKGAGGKSRPEGEMLGKTVKGAGEKPVIVGLEEDLLDVPDEQMNLPFRRWKRALEAYRKRGPIEFRRLALGDDNAFDFLTTSGNGATVEAQVLGPILTTAGGKKGLRFLGDPPKGPHLDHDPTKPTNRVFSGLSASHTINGHSVILRLRYGNFRFLFAGDLNEEAEAELVNKHADELRAEVFKVPHHGSADFSTQFIQSVCPLVSVVSSGDETRQKEFIHPRASLMAALGRCSRTASPLVLCTELVAFFEMMGYVDPERHQMKDGIVVIKGGKAQDLKKVAKSFFAFARAAYGLVKVRTDGKRLLVYTDSANVHLKEAYAYESNGLGNPVPDMVRAV